MEIKMIDSERLNIYLTQEEVEFEQVDLTKIETAKDLKKKFGRIFETAERYYGFNMDNSPLEIEVIPIIDGGLFIGLSKKEDDELSVVHYVFLDFEAVLSVVDLIDSGFVEGELYLYENAYHLIARIKLNKKDRVTAVLDEFGLKPQEKDIHNVSLSVLQEHGESVCEQNCIQTLKNYFFTP
ncbi:MAG: adaptor protein MecA [Clostridia bacterium]|nr:adaptor protein MecA [Clostridia bacterium]